MKHEWGVAGGLATVLIGGAVLIGAVAALFAVADSSGTSTETQSVTVTAAAPQPSTAAASTAGTTAASETGTTAASETGATAAASLPAEVEIGARAYTQFACGACHGWHGEGGISPSVPSLTGAGSEFTALQLRHIIDHGAGVSSDPTKPFMPVWGPVISDAQVNALVAYIKAGLPAVAGIEAVTPPEGATPEAAGSILYETYGCINCHGPNGLGGVPNPGSPDKAVPPLVGADFAAEFDTPQKISDIINSGSVIGKAPIVAMPHWGGIIPQTEIDDLASFIQSLTRA